MRIGILGTGVVGKTLGTKLAKLGNDVKMGSRKAGGEKAKAEGHGYSPEGAEGGAGGLAGGFLPVRCLSSAIQTLTGFSSPESSW